MARGYRLARINDAVKQEMSQIISDVKDPRIQSIMITVTGADVTPDLKYAKIYYSFLGKEDEAEIKKGLKSSIPFMRGQLAKRLNLRITPELTFIFDDSVQKGDRIDELLKSISDKEKETNGKI